MSTKRLVTIIIPTWNMARFLAPLFDSIVDSDFSRVVQEIIFVCDQSTDGSEDRIRELIARQGDRLPKVRLIVPPERRGLFVARYLGASAATTAKIMFIDSRITLPDVTRNQLGKLLEKYPAMVAHADIDTEKNLFCLYWERSHDRFFRSHKDTREITHITPENFNRIRIGGTCFICSRDPFVRISEGYLERQSGLFSDDTMVFADLVKIEPFTLHPDYRINWEPRDQAWSFLKHLYTRGPGFAQYNLFRIQGPLFYAVIGGASYLVLLTILLLIAPLWSFALAGAGLFGLLASTALVARSASEFFRLAPLHAAVIVFYGLGALRGAYIVFRRTRANASRKRATA